MVSMRGIAAVALLLATAVGAGAQRGTMQPVILPVVDASDVHFSRVTFGSSRREPAYNRVHAIAQDAMGFLWFATQDKLQRYDGYEIREYPNDPNGPDAVYTEESLFIDRRGILWGGWARGLDRFDPATESFKRYSTERPFNTRVISTTQDRAGNLWFSTNMGLLRVDPGTGRAVTYEHNPEDPATLSSSRVRRAFEAKDGTLWVATLAGVDLIDQRTGKVRQHIRFPADFPELDPNPELHMIFYEDHAGVMWITFSYGYGLARINRQAGTFDFYSLDGTGKDNTLQSGARAIIETGDDTIWIGTTASGILRLNRERSRFIRYRNNPADPNSISGDQVQALFLDREGNMWAGTNGAGVNRFSPRSSPFTVFQHRVGDPNSLDSNYTSSILEDSRGQLWIGSIRALQRLDRKTGKMAFYRRSGGLGELSSTWIISMAEDLSGRLWLGTVGRGVNRLDRRTGKFKVFRHDPADPRSLSHDTAQAILVDRRGVVWIGTEDGLNEFDEATESFRVYKASKTLNAARVDYIAEDHGGTLWIATQSTGLVRFDPDRLVFTSYRHTSDIHSLSDDVTNSVCIDSNGMIWVGTQNGLNQMDPRAGTFTRYYERDGLAGNNVSKILVDDGGDLWVSTSRGLSRFDVRNRTFKNYFVSDGIAGNEFYNYASAFKSHTGEMFFSSYAGVTAFFPHDVVDNPYVPPVVITDLRVAGKSLPIGGDSPVAQAIPFTKAVDLSHNQNLVSLQFSALSFTNPDGNRYRYRMEGLESSWYESTSDQRFITYSLSPGDYTFRVKGSNSRGAWNEDGTSLHIVILTPWWSSSWFRVVIAAFCIALLGTAYRFRMWQVQRESKQLRDVIETIPAYVWSALPDGSVDFINRRWLEFSGFSLDQALGWGWADAVHPEDRGRLDDAWRAAVASGNAMEAEARMRSADGQYRWLLIRGVPLRDRSGKIIKWYGKSTDIEALKRAEQEREMLRQLESDLAHINRVSMMGELAASVAHEVNQPLTGIVNNGSACLRLLAGDTPNVEEAREAVGDIVRDGKRAGEVIARIRAMTKRAAMPREHLDLNDVIQEVLVLVKDEAKKRIVIIQTEFAGDFAPVIGDRVQLQQVVLNLVMNAIEAMSNVDGRRREMMVRTRNVDGGQVQVTVEDSGVGLDPNTTSKIFEPFFTTKSSGMGMGLSICRSIVQSHGGRIWASANDGPGTSFHFTLPQYHAEEQDARVTGA